MAANRWDSTLYDTRHGFVSQFGEDMMTRLAPKPHERILDADMERRLRVIAIWKGAE